MKQCDVIVIGAGIIGAACAWQLAKRGQSVTLIDNGQPGATAAGMGHLACMDDDPAELCLVGVVAGTLARYHAADARQLRLARLRHAVAGGKRRRDDRRRRKQRRMAGHRGAQRTPDLQQIAGARAAAARRAGRRASGYRAMASFYAPNIARWLIADAGDHLPARAGIAHRRLTSRRCCSPAANGQAGAGDRGGSRPRSQRAVSRKPAATEKGQLAITDRHRPRVQHQLVELGYGASAHGGGTSVALNLQPRPNRPAAGLPRRVSLITASASWICLSPAQMLDRARHFRAGAGDVEYHPPLERFCAPPRRMANPPDRLRTPPAVAQHG